MCSNLLKSKKRLLPRKTKRKCWYAQGAMEIPKTLGLPSKITPVSQVSLKDGETISFDEKTNNNSFKNF